MTGHLIHIGFAKAGSTFLQRWFESHPQLHYREGGIAGFRDVYDISRQSADPPAAIRYRVTSSEGLATPHAFVGARTIDYRRIRGRHMPAAQAAACETLAALFPGAHILIVTRGFRSVMVSGYSQYVRTGGLDDFATLRERFGRDEDGGGASWDYDGLVRRYRERFGDRLIVLPYELLRDDREHFVRAIEERLGLDHHPAPAATLNPGLSPAELAWYPRISRTVHRLLPGGRLGDRLYGAYAAAASRNRLRPLARLLQRLRPLASVTPETIPQEVVERFRGKADILRENPFYAAYRDEYLL